MSNVRTIQEVNLTIATAQANASTDETIVLREDMEHCHGISIIVNNLAGITRHTGRITDKTGGLIYMDPVNVKSLEVGTSIPPHERFYPVSFPAAGKTLKVTIDTEGTTSGEYNVDVQFHLSKSSQ